MSRFARNVLTLGSGNVASQLISIVAVPVITRLYAPAEFGAFSFVFALVAVLFPISTLRLHAAILLPKDDETGASLLRWSIAAVLASSLIVMPVLALTLYWTAPIDAQSKGVLWYLVIGVLVHGLVLCCQFWLLRHKRFGVMASGAIGESVADRLFAILVGLAQHGQAAWLCLARVVGAGVHLCILALQTARHDIRPRCTPGRTREEIEVLHRYRQFPLYATWASILGNGARELPTLVFAGMFSAAAAGMYALGVRVLGFPMLMIGDAIARVFFRYATELTDEPERLQESTQLLVRFVIYLMYPPMLVLSIAGPQLFEAAFGAAWTEAGTFAQILAMSFLVTFVYRVLSIFFDIRGMQPARLAFDAAQFLLRIVAMTIGGLGFGATGAVWGLLLGTLLVHGTAAIYLLTLSGMTITGTVGLLSRTLVNLVPFSVVIIAVGGLPLGDVRLWALVLAGIAMQLVWLVRREPRMVTYARQWVQ